MTGMGWYSLRGVGKEEGELFNPFAEILSKWAREVYGLAQTIVLTPEATQELGHRIGHYAVGPWTLRTYFPGVDHRSSVDSVRHRYMGTDQLAQQKPAAVPSCLVTQLVGMRQRGQSR